MLYNVDFSNSNIKTLTKDIILSNLSQINLSSDDISSIILLSTDNMIQKNCFEGFHNLSNVENLEYSTFIGQQAFKDCPITSDLNLSNANFIGFEAFKNVKSKDVVFGTNLSSIGSSAFESNENLLSITFNSNIDLGKKVFKDCIQLQLINNESCIDAMHNTTFQNTKLNFNLFKINSKNFDDKMFIKENADKITPNNIFLVWFGDKLPDYIDFTLNQYSQMQKEFDIFFIHYTKNEIFNAINDEALNISKGYIQQYIDNWPNIYSSYIQYRIDNRFTYLQILSDIYRIELIRRYGGIYVDVDTIPMKNFNGLLSQDAFCQQILDIQKIDASEDFKYREEMKIKDLEDLQNLKIIFYDDNYFIASKSGFTEKEISISPWFKVNGKKNIYSWLKNLENTEYFKDIKQKFYKNQLTKDDLNDMYSKYYSYYLIHFSTKNWNTKTIQSNSLFSAFDYKLYKDISKKKVLTDTIQFICQNDIDSFENEYPMTIEMHQMIDNAVKELTNDNI